MSSLASIKRSAKDMAKRRVKDAFFGRRIPEIYKKSCEQPVNSKKVIFLETKEQAFPDSFKVLWNYLENNYDFDLEYITLEQNYVSRKRYLQNCETFAKTAATAAYIFLCDASDLVSCLPLRPETKVIQLWHACGAFKKWGMSTAELKFGNKGKDIQRHPFYGNLSLVTVSSPEVMWAYTEAMMLQDRPEIVQPLGVSRTDVFFDPKILTEVHSAVEKVVPQAKGKKIILYAPTFRGQVSTATGPDKLDVAALQAAVGTKYILLIKHHPFVKERPPIPKECKDFAFDVSESLPIDSLLSVADVCISDYSSVIFEYSLFERPMVFFAYDKEDYDDWRGFYYDYDALTPGPVFTENGALIDYLVHLEERFDPSVVQAFKRKFMSACDGHATERICKAVFGDQHEHHQA